MGADTTFRKLPKAVKSPPEPGSPPATLANVGQEGSRSPRRIPSSWVFHARRSGRRFAPPLRRALHEMRGANVGQRGTPELPKDTKLVGDPLHDDRDVASLRPSGVLFTRWGANVGQRGIPESSKDPRLMGDPLHDDRGVAPLPPPACSSRDGGANVGQRGTPKLPKDPKLMGEPLHDVRGVAPLRPSGVLFTSFGANE